MFKRVCKANIWNKRLVYIEKFEMMLNMNINIYKIKKGLLLVPFKLYIKLSSCNFSRT